MPPVVELLYLDSHLVGVHIEDFPDVPFFTGEIKLRIVDVLDTVGVLAKLAGREIVRKRRHAPGAYTEHVVVGLPSSPSVIALVGMFCSPGWSGPPG